MALAIALLAACKATPKDTANPADAREANGTAAASTVTSTAASAAPSTGQPSAVAGRTLLTKDSYAVISGVLTWKDPKLASFSKTARKDQALHDQLLALGIAKSQLQLLLDEEASRDNIIGGLKALAKRVPAGGTFVFYYAGHGVKADDGKAYFACHDIDTAQSAATGLSMAAVTDAIANNFNGGQVLLLADCCYSGALAGVAKALQSKGINAVSLTSADASNVSTGNWTYTMSLLSCLRGDALCDADGNGVIGLAEVASEVHASMKHREGQRSGFANEGVPAGLSVVRVKQQSELGVTQRRRYLEARIDQRWRPVRLRSVQGKRRTVRLYGYADYRDVALTAGHTRTVNFRRYPVGSSIRVYWGGKLWDAKVERSDGDFHFVSYPGWPAYWNEWITSRRIEPPADKTADSPGHDDRDDDAPRFAAGSAVSVEWHGGWYPATVLVQTAGRHRVHYDGYEDSWDEWVGPQRIRKR